jgi:hypothetical protein
MRKLWPDSIREINDLPLAEKSVIYHSLIPNSVFSMFDIDPRSYIGPNNLPAVHIRAPQGSSAVEISIFCIPGSDEPAIYLHMGDSFNSQLMVFLVVINDPDSPRFNVDVDEQGNPNQLGTERRNIPEERRAMQAGLAPGQVRGGLRIFRAAMQTFETFVKNMAHELFFVEPLFYHNALAFERYGFAYSRGLPKMQAIHQGFQPGGLLHARLSVENPFRQPDAWLSVRGRSWAIHDGILDEPFAGVQMYKRVGRDAGLRTFPDSKW